MRTIIVLLVLLLAGCGAEDPYRGYGSHYDEISELGVRYRIDDDFGTIGTTPLTTEAIDRAYREVAECLGVWYEPDLLVILTFDMPDGKGGYTYWTSGESAMLILLRAHLFTVEQYFMLKHELVHYFLRKSTGNGDPGHNSTLFETCSGIAE